MSEIEAVPTVTPIAKNALGQFTSKYDPEFAAQMVEYMANGYTLTAACGKFRVTKKTIYNWQEAHPEFKEACEVALMARQNFLENAFLTTKYAPDITKYIFALKNAKTSDDWQEKQNIEVSGPNGQAIQHEVHQIEWRVIEPPAKKVEQIEDNS